MILPFPKPVPPTTKHLNPAVCASGPGLDGRNWSGSKRLRDAFSEAYQGGADLPQIGQYPDAKHLNGLVDRIDLSKGQFRVRLDPGALQPTEKAKLPIHAAFEVPAQKRQTGRARPIIIAPPDAPQPDQGLINLVADARRWSAEFLDGTSSAVRQIEDREGLRSGSVRRIQPLAWLAPDISTGILESRQPQHRTAKKLRSLPEQQLDWHEQRKILGFPHLIGIGRAHPDRVGAAFLRLG